MESQTRSATLAVEPEAVFDYVARPENLPAWAPAFARSVRMENDHWVAASSNGDVAFALRLSREYGIVDVLIGVASGVYVLAAPTRVVANPAGGSEFLFTLFRRPAEDDAQFAERLDALDDEFATLQRILEKPVLR